MKGLAGDVGRFVRGEEHRRRGNLLAGAKPARGDRRQNRLALLYSLLTEFSIIADFSEIVTEGPTA